MSSWPGYAAAAVAFLFAAVSLYWVMGGTAGLSTLGGIVEELARARAPGTIAVTWVIVLLKIVGGVLALALVQTWGRRLPQRWLIFVAWAAAALLIVYGVVQMTGVALVALGITEPAVRPDPTVLAWRLLLWEPWFLVLGVLLALAARYAQRIEPVGS